MDTRGGISHFLNTYKKGGQYFQGKGEGKRRLKLNLEKFKKNLKMSDFIFPWDDEFFQIFDINWKPIVEKIWISLLKQKIKISLCQMKIINTIKQATNWKNNRNILEKV